jgi:hypothetical protein
MVQKGKEWPHFFLLGRHGAGTITVAERREFASLISYGWGAVAFGVNALKEPEMPRPRIALQSGVILCVELGGCKDKPIVRTDRYCSSELYSGVFDGTNAGIKISLLKGVIS